MALTAFWAGILRLLAAPRRSRDIDQFHDTEEALAATSARDSAYRFLPLVADDLMGLALHPFGYLAWAACGKDPGYNPLSLLAAARRLRYGQAEVNTLDVDG